MKSSQTQTGNIKVTLERLPGIASVNEVRIEHQLIEHVSVQSKSLGRLTPRYGTKNKGLNVTLVPVAKGTQALTGTMRRRGGLSCKLSLPMLTGCWK